MGFCNNEIEKLYEGTRICERVRKFFFVCVCVLDIYNDSVCESENVICGSVYVCAYIYVCVCVRVRACVIYIYIYIYKYSVSGVGLCVIY